MKQREGEGDGSRQKFPRVRPANDVKRRTRDESKKIRNPVNMKAASTCIYKVHYRRSTPGLHNAI